MSPASETEFKKALRQLHRVKDAAYRDAWKKRGEVMSVMANIARKVDRLEYAVDGAPATDDESHLDTVIDLLVYALKYQTYLADQDSLIARELFEDSGIVRPYSDGTAGFDALVTQLDTTPMEHHVSQSTTEATREVLNAFRRA